MTVSVGCGGREEGTCLVSAIRSANGVTGQLCSYVSPGKVRKSGLSHARPLSKTPTPRAVVVMQSDGIRIGQPESLTVAVGLSFLFELRSRRPVSAEAMSGGGTDPLHCLFALAVRTLGVCTDAPDGLHGFEVLST